MKIFFLFFLLLSSARAEDAPVEPAALPTPVAAEAPVEPVLSTPVEPPPLLAEPTPVLETSETPTSAAEAAVNQLHPVPPAPLSPVAPADATTETTAVEPTIPTIDSVAEVPGSVPVAPTVPIPLEPTPDYGPSAEEGYGGLELKNGSQILELGRDTASVPEPQPEAMP